MVIDIPLPQLVRASLASLALHTPVRRGIERVSQSRGGGLFVLGWDESVEAVCAEGFRHSGVEASPESLSQLSKMDLAIVISSDGARIVRSNTILKPRSDHAWQGSGARHLVASNTARDITYPVVAVSEETGAITLFVGEHAFLLSSKPVLLSKAAIALLTLDTCVRTLLSQERPTGVRSSAEWAEKARATVVELEMYLLELGEIGAHLDEIVADHCRRLDLERPPLDPYRVPGRVPLMHAVVRELDAWHDEALNAADHILSSRPGLVGNPGRPFPRMSFDSERQALRWYDLTWRQLLDAIAHAVDIGDHETALRRSMSTLEYFYRRKPWRDWITVLSAAVVAARQLGDQAAEASLLASSGVAHREMRNFALALELMEGAHAIWRELGDEAGQAEVLNHLAFAHDEAGAAGEALRCARMAVELAQNAGDRRLEGKVLNNLGGIHCRSGQLDVAMAHVVRAEKLFEEEGYQRGVVWALVVKGNVHRGAGRHVEAVECHRAALAGRVEMGDDYGAAICHIDLATTLFAQGDENGAREHLTRAWRYFDAVGDPRAVDVRARLDGVAG